jgi:hypothetical protein
MNWKLPLLLLLPAAVMALLGAQHTLAHNALVGETIEQIDGPGYFGLVSNFGIAFWLLGGASACLGAATLWSAAGARREAALFLGGYGFWTLWLGWDDAYVIHEEVLPNKAGINEHIVIAGYVMVTIALLVRFRRQLANSDLPLLIGALTFVTASEVIDQFFDSTAHKFLEESFKFIGIFAWASYLIIRSAKLIRAELKSQEAVL